MRATWTEHMAPAVQANAGHEAYVYCSDPDEPDAIIAFQLYRDAQAAADFMRTPAYQEYERLVSPLLQGPPQIQRLQPLWRKTSPTG